VNSPAVIPGFCPDTQSGGFALMQDGTTVKKLTPAEFQAAPKAGNASSTGVAGKS